jgi:glucose-6-phosphate dehydrogenase assembly protein OpcA
MTAPAPVPPGLPVELGEIERQLGQLWEQSDAGKVRASLVNLVIHSEAPDAIAANTPLLASIAADHAFRALLVQANPTAPASSIRAWITAHCHLRDAGKQEICSEQITFQLDGPAAGRLPSIVFSHLDTDLPLYMWWQGNLHEDPDPQLWTWVDRLIVDSQSWSDPARQFRLLHEVETIARGRCAVCDLTWTRLFHLRYAMAGIFDIAAGRERIAALRKIEILHAPGHRITALELLGWLASRLHWTLEESRLFRRPDGGAVEFLVAEQPGASSCIASVTLDFGDATATVRRDPGGDFLLLDFNAPGLEPFSQMLPAGRERTADILLSELSRVSRHPLYWPSIRAIEPLLRPE